MIDPCHLPPLSLTRQPVKETLTQAWVILTSRQTRLTDHRLLNSMPKDTHKGGIFVSTLQMENKRPERTSNLAKMVQLLHLRSLQRLVSLVSWQRKMDSK